MSLSSVPPSYFLLLPIVPILFGIYLKHRHSRRISAELWLSSALDTFVSSVATRRSIYIFASGLPQGVSRQQIQKDVVEKLVKYTPASYNAESSRVLLLWGEKSVKLWGLVWEGIEQAANFPTEDARAKSKLKITQLGNAAGTLLFFEDSEIIAKFGSPTHFEQSSGMLQINVWTALSTLGVGASLHHYSNLIDTSIHTLYSLPSSWVLKGEMPFGAIGEPAGYKRKTFAGRVRVVGGGDEIADGGEKGGKDEAWMGMA